MLTVLDSSTRSQTGGMENSKCKQAGVQVEDFAAQEGAQNRQPAPAAIFLGAGRFGGHLPPKLRRTYCTCGRTILINDP